MEGEISYVGTDTGSGDVNTGSSDMLTPLPSSDMLTQLPSSEMLMQLRSTDMLTQLPSASGDPVRVRPDALLVTCRFLSIFTCFATFLCIAFNVISAVKSLRNGSGIFDGIFRIYSTVLAVFVLVGETNWEFVMKFWKIQEYWVARGILQISVAVMTRAYPEYLRDGGKDLFFLQRISSYLLLISGVVYFISGALCISIAQRARQFRELSREQAINDLEDLQRSREEVESRLLEIEVEEETASSSLQE